MARLNIVKEGDDVLHKKCREVEAVTPRIIRTIEDMVDTLHAAGGVGLAAPQVGVLRRIAVVEVEPGKVYDLINPQIIEAEGVQETVEGCLSLPGEWGITRRPMRVTVTAMNRYGKKYTETVEGLAAKAFCHEIDHLDGIMYTERAIRMLEADEIEEDDD